MATPNYSYEKRQKELAKKRKKEDKLKRKTEGHPDDSSDNATDENGEEIQPTEPDAPPHAPSA